MNYDSIFLIFGLVFVFDYIAKVILYYHIAVNEHSNNKGTKALPFQKWNSTYEKYVVKNIK